MMPRALMAHLRPSRSWEWARVPVSSVEGKGITDYLRGTGAGAYLSPPLYPEGDVTIRATPAHR